MPNPEDPCLGGLYEALFIGFVLIRQIQKTLEWEDYRLYTILYLIYIYFFILMALSREDLNPEDPT